MGDALAIALMNERNFQSEDFAIFHPGGRLGRRLLTKVEDVMRQDNLPIVSPTTSLGDVIITISNARLGIAAIVENEVLIGVITDGDIRRAMTLYKAEFFSKEAKEIMSKSPKTILPSKLIMEAEKIMHDNKIHSIIVTNSDNKVEGIVEFYNVS